MKFHLSFFVFAYLLCFTSCDSDNPFIPNEEEVITTVVLTFTPSDVKEETVEFTYTDLDGDGGDTVTITNGTLVVIWNMLQMLSYSMN